MIHQFIKYGVKVNSNLHFNLTFKALLQANNRAFSTMIEAQLASQVVKGPKNHKLDPLILKLLTIAEARALYYSNQSYFQDHHYILFMQRLQQVQQLGGTKASKKDSIELLTEKLKSKIMPRILSFDSEDMLTLLRFLSKQSPQDRQFATFVQQAMIQVAKCFEKEELIVEMKTLYDLKHWISLMININVIYGNVISPTNTFVEGIEKAYSDIGQIISDEIKRSVQSQTNQTVDEMMELLEQLSKFQLKSLSVIKEIMNKTIPKISSHKHCIQILHIMTRLEQQHDQKIIGRFVKQINENISKLTYDQLGQYLESLVLLDFKSSPEFAKQIIDELELRQTALSTKEKGDQANKSLSLSVLNCLKITRSLLQLGLQHELSESFILWKVLSNIIFKNVEKMTASQLMDFHHILSQSLMYPTQSHIKQRMGNVQSAVMKSIESKILKFNPQKIIFMLTRDKYMMDTIKILRNASKEYKSNILQAIVSNIHEVHYMNELNMVSLLYTKEMFEENKFIGVVLTQFQREAKEIKSKFLKKKDDVKTKEHLLTLNKLLYLICFHEAKSAFLNQLSPQVILEREHLKEVKEQLEQLHTVGALKKYPGDEYEKQVKKFQNLILNNQITLNFYESEQSGSEHKASTKLEKVSQAFKDKGLEVELNKEIALSDTQKVILDLYCPDSKTGFAIQTQSKMNHDTRFIQQKSMLDSNNISMYGDQEFTLSRQILNFYHESQLDYIDAYALKFNKSIHLKLIDHKRIKEDSYVSQLIKA